MIHSYSNEGGKLLTFAKNCHIMPLDDLTIPLWMMQTSPEASLLIKLLITKIVYSTN